MEAADLIAAGATGLGMMKAKSCNVKVVTDGLLVLSLEALESAVAAAPYPKPSGRAQHRALAMLVAGAVAGDFPAGEDEQLLAGKRLQRQAIKVRDQLLEASRYAASERVEARRVAAEERAEEADLAAALAAITASELMQVNKLATEVYIGFYELIVNHCPALPPPLPAPTVPEPVSMPPWLCEVLGKEGHAQCAASAWLARHGPRVWPEDGESEDASCLWFIANELGHLAERHARDRVQLDEVRRELEGEREGNRIELQHLSLVSEENANDLNEMREEMWKMRTEMWASSDKIFNMRWERDEAVHHMASTKELHKILEARVAELEAVESCEEGSDS